VPDNGQEKENDASGAYNGNKRPSAVNVSANSRTVRFPIRDTKTRKTSSADRRERFRDIKKNRTARVRLRAYDYY